MQKDKSNKKILLTNKKAELVELEIQKKDKNDLIKKLKKTEEYFKKELQKQQQAAKQLDKRIREIIEEEIRKAREAEKKSNKEEFALTPEAKALSDNFLENKGNTYLQF